MESPALVGIAEPRPFPRWRLILALILLLGSGLGFSCVLRMVPIPIPIRGGFLFLHWMIPCGLVVVGLTWALWRRREADRHRSVFWGVLMLAILQLAGLLGWLKWRDNMRDLNHIVYSSRVEYVALADRPADWCDPTHPQVYDLGSGLRLALSPVIWTDGLHRSLPLAAAPNLDPYPDSGDPRPLSELGQRNLAALVKAIALIRFFHPTDAAQFSDWGRLISQGVRQVEDASTTEELAKRLQALLAPYAPTARMLLPGEAAPRLPVPEGAKLVARWHHIGVGFECAVQGFTGPTKDRSARLAGVGMAWTTFQHFYPYWDVVGVDWEAVLPASLREAAMAPSHEAYFEVIQHLCSQMKDGHAWPVDFGMALMGHPDVALRALDGRVLVAARWGLDEGIPLGAELLSVNGEPVAQRMSRRLAVTQGATPQYREGMAARLLLLAPPNQSLHLEVADIQGKQSSHDVLVRRQISPRESPEPIREVKPGILLVELDRVDSQAFKKALPRLVEAKALIFDHRGYPEQVDFLQHFQPKPLEGVQLQLPVNLLPNGVGRTFETSRFKVGTESPYYKGRVVVLAGGLDDISFAESCLEVISANHLAPIVGRPTMGTNGDVLSFILPGNIRCGFTATRVLKADGSQHHGIGILPTHPVKRTREGVAQGRDEDLERALKLLETGA